MPPAAPLERQPLQLQRWRVVFRRVAVRSGPSTGHPIVGVRRDGDVVRSAGSSRDGRWIALADDDDRGRPFSSSSSSAASSPSESAWMLVDGASVGLGTLLEPILPPPRLVFAGTRAVVVEWDAAAEDDDAARNWLAGPPRLIRRGGAEVEGVREATDDAADPPPSRRRRRVRIGGLSPNSPLALRLAGREADADDGREIRGDWLELRTRDERIAPSPRGPDAFGRWRGRLDVSVAGDDAARDDCPHGFWIPEGMMEGGFNASMDTVRAIRCGDCAFPSAAHEKWDPSVFVPDNPLAGGKRSSAFAAIPDIPRSCGEKVGEQSQSQSKKSYFERFRAWDESRPSWRRLHAEPGGGGTTAAVHGTSDLHVDFPDNLRWLESLPPRLDRTLIVAGDICHSLETLESALRRLVSLYQHVFYVPGNHELWISPKEDEGNSAEKFLRILALADRCGVHARPAWVAEGVCVVPLFSWYKKTFLGAAAGGARPSRLEEGFDRACSWPPSIGSKNDPHDSLAEGIADFFLSCNAGRFERPDWPRELPALPAGGNPAGARNRPVVLSFSHFIPRPECYKGYSALEKVMGCRELDTQVRSASSDVHVFGHSHLPVDVTLSGVRYVQRALGYPRDWGGHRGPPLALWESGDGKEGKDLTER